MDFPKHINTKSMVYGSPFCDLRGHISKFLNFDVTMSMKIVFILGNSVDPDEMLPYAAFHQGLHCLPKYPFTSIKNEKN